MIRGAFQHRERERERERGGERERERERDARRSMRRKSRDRCCPSRKTRRNALLAGKRKTRATKKCLTRHV
jgi:hypothetical protein